MKKLLATSNFFIVRNVFQSLFIVIQSAGCNGLCSEQGHCGQGTVMPVCNGSSSNMADEVFIDMSGAPTQRTSTYFCTLTFQRSGENHVDINLSTEDRENGTVTINIDRLYIRARSITYEMISIRRMKLTITPRDTTMRSCLQLKKTTTDTSSFKAACYPPGIYTGDTKTVTGYPECDKRNKDSESGKFRDNALIGPVAGGVIGGYFVVKIFAIFIIKRQRKNTSAREEHNMTAI